MKIGAILVVPALLAAGCAAHDSAPALLPLFMAESVSVQAETANELPADAAVGDEAITAAELAETLPMPTALPDDDGVTLDQAIRACFDSDPKLRAGWETIRQAEGELLTSSLPPNPQFLADGIFLPLRPFTRAKPGGPPQTDFNVSYPIDWLLFGKRAAAMASGRRAVDVSASDFADLVRQRIAAVIAAFFDVLEADALLKLAREDLESLKRVEQITRERAKLGGVGTIETDRIHLDVLNSQRELRNREKTRAAAVAILRSLMGYASAAPTFRASGSLDVIQPAEPLGVEEAFALAEEGRPDLISLRRQLAKAEADVHLEKTKGCPTVTPAAALSRQFQKFQGVPDAPSYDVSLTVSVPILDRNQGNIMKAEATRAQVGYNLQTQFVALRAEIEQAVLEFRVAHANVTADDPEQLKTARSVRDRIEAAYKAGGRPLIEVLDAERAYRETYRLYIQGRSGYWHSLYKLNAAIGQQVLK